MSAFSIQHAACSIHPRARIITYQPQVDSFVNTIPNTLSMEFNWLTLNGKAGPATTPLTVKQGERVRIRLVNWGMVRHPIQGGAFNHTKGATV